MFAGAFLYAITHGYTAEDAARLALPAVQQSSSRQLGPRLRGDVTALPRDG